MSKKSSKKFSAKTYGNREQWLAKAAAHIAERVFKPAGIDLPVDFKVSCSWPGGGSASKRFGECWPRAASAAKVNEVFISPTISSAMAALGILTHELAHVADDCKSGHKGAFKRHAVAVGLIGEMTATVAGPLLQPKLQKIAGDLGAYPHATLSLAGRKKQGTRMIKVECPECSGVFRTTQKWIKQADGLRCPFCSCDDVHVEGDGEED